MLRWINNQFGLIDLCVLGSDKILAAALSSGTNEESVDSSSSGLNAASENTFSSGCYDSSVSADAGADASTADPQSGTGLSTVGVVMSSCTATNNALNPDTVIEVNEVRKDAIPYTKVEKNAQLTFRMFNKKNTINKSRILIIPNDESYKKAKKILYKEPSGINCDNLEVLKRVLEKNEE